MKKSKTALVILTAMLLSACGEGDVTGETTWPETSETESSVTETVSVSEETSAETTMTTAVSTITETETSTSASEENSEEKKKITWEDASTYFAKNYYKFEYNHLYIDMNDYWDGYDPLADIDEEYLGFISYLILENAGSRDLSFLNNYRFSWLTLERYSGNADFEKMNFNALVLDDYRGGDLSTLSSHDPDVFFDSDWLRFTNYSGDEDLSCLADLDSVIGLYFEYYAPDTDFSFISGCPNVKSLILKNQRINADDLAKLMKNSNIKSLYITVEEYSSEDAELIMQAAPDSSVNYIQDDTPWDSMRVYKNCVKVAVDPVVDIAARSDTDPYFFGVKPEEGDKSLNCTFNNYTDEVHTVTSLEIFRTDSDGIIPIPFADGSLVYETDLSIETGCTEFKISEDIFPFSKCEPGIYKVIFNTADNEKIEQKFAICSSDYSFLTDEQLEILNKGHEITHEYFGCSTYMSQDYADTHTADEFLENLYPAYTHEYAYKRASDRYMDSDGNLKAVSGDRGGDVTVYANFFMPVSSNENEVTLKNFVIHYHDNPYFAWYEELNYHMIKTEDGWRFDKYQLWY